MAVRASRIEAPFYPSNTNASRLWSRRNLLRVLPAAGIGAVGALYLPLHLSAESRREGPSFATVSASDHEGAVDFDSSDQKLVIGFHWAKA
jgi:hypothetical protein